VSCGLNNSVGKFENLLPENALDPLQSKIKIQDGFSHTNFRTPPHFLESLKNNTSIGENRCQTNTKSNEYEKCVKCVFVLVCRRFSPTFVF
jgi:hypothetical protein